MLDIQYIGNNCNIVAYHVYLYSKHLSSLRIASNVHIYLPDDGIHKPKHVAKHSRDQ
jgi:hypothetical protein